MTQLADVERVLSLFIEGISGDYYHIRSVDNPNSDSDKPSVFGTPTNTLFFPEQIDMDPATGSGVFCLLALRQLAFREFGTYEFRLDIARDHIEGLPDEPDRLLSHQSELQRFFSLFELPSLFARVFLAIELARVEYRMLRMYPGASKYCSLAPLADDRTDGASAGRDLADLYATLPNSSDAFTAFGEILDLVCTEAATVYTSAKAAVGCYELLASSVSHVAEDQPAMSSVPLEEIQNQVELENLEQEVDSLTAQIAGAEFDLVDGELSAEEGTIADGMERDVEVELLRERDRLQRQMDISRSGLGLPYSERTDDWRSFRYDEWNYLENCFMRGWCQLYEKHLDDPDPEYTNRLVHNIQPFVRRVRKQFEAIRPVGLRTVRRVIEGDDIDLGGLVDAVADMEANQVPDGRIYSHRIPAKRDISSAFLVDMSASTDDEVSDSQADVSDAESGGGAPQNLRDPYFDEDEYPFGSLDYRPVPPDIPKRRIIDVLLEAVLLLSTALERLGDQYGVYGFSGYGHDCVEFYVAKEFSQSLNAETVGAITAMKPKRSTRMGTAIRHACRKLQATESAIRMLIVISDGFPQDCDYGPDRSSHEYGVQDTAMALREAEALGIVTFCLTVDQSGHDYLRRMCPDQHYLVIEETSEVSPALQSVYRRLSAL